MKRDFFKTTMTTDKKLFPPTAGIRKVNWDDPEDLRRLAVIDGQPEVLKQMMGRRLSDRGLKNFATDNGHKSLYVVSGMSLVAKEETGRLQGWILVYSGSEVTRRVERALKRKIGQNQTGVLEVSYAKYPAAPPGQMAGGLRQVLLDVVLKSGTGWWREELIYQQVVAAFAAPDNFRSRFVLEAAGFRLQTQRIYWSLKNPGKQDLVYLLDWERLKQKCGWGKRFPF